MADVRRIAPEDWQFLRALRLEALADSPSAFGATLAEEERIGQAKWQERIERDAWFAAVADGAGVGLVAGASFSPAPAKDLISMWVRHDVRGSGVASDLMTAAVAWARAEGADKLLLWVTEGNQPARRFYQRMGFVPTGNRTVPPSDAAMGEDELQLLL